MNRIPRDLVKHLEWTPGKEAPASLPPIASPSLVKGGIVLEHDDFVFEQLEVALGHYVDLSLRHVLLPGGKKTQPNHWKAVQEATDGIVLPNGQVLYAMMHRAYMLRDDAAAGEVLDSLRALLKLDWETNYPHTGTRIDYVQNSLEATIQHLQLDGTVAPYSVAIPEFTRANDNWSYLTLANEQPETALGTVNELPENAKPFLESLLGPHYEDAGAVFQYLSSRRADNLRETRVWTPTLSNRATQRALVLGVGIYDRFYINANYDVGDVRPARGVAVRKK